MRIFSEWVHFLSLLDFDLYCYHHIRSIVSLSMANHHRLKVNRNKKSVGLSFQHPDGVKILHELAKTSDVLVENYIPGK